MTEAILYGAVGFVLCGSLVLAAWLTRAGRERRRAELIDREHAEGVAALRRAMEETPWRVRGIEREQQ